MTSYRGKTLFDTEPNWATRPGHEFENEYKELKYYGLGYGYSDYDETVMFFKFGLSFTSREEIHNFVTFFDQKWGRLEHFWVPSWQADVEVTAAFDAGDNDITIKDIKYSDYWLSNDVTGRHIMLIFPDGTQICRKIITAVDSTSLSLDEVIGKACTEEELPVLLISFLHFARFDMDELELNYYNPWTAACEVTFKTLYGEASTTTTTV